MCRCYVIIRAQAGPAASLTSGRPLGDGEAGLPCFYYMVYIGECQIHSDVVTEHDTKTHTFVIEHYQRHRRPLV